MPNYFYVTKSILLRYRLYNFREQNSKIKNEYCFIVGIRIYPGYTGFDGDSAGEDIDSVSIIIV